MTERSSVQRFEVLAVLGSGGMGTVYRARDPRLERIVAIKILRNVKSGARSALDTTDTLDLRGASTSRDVLLREARVMARLSHPNVVSIYEAGLDEHNDVFLVMEYVDGVDLRQWSTPERTPNELATVLAQAARGLAAAHECGIVHQDVKPANILIGTDGRARVGDFGISRLVEPSGLVNTARIAGTPRYMAPEAWSEAVTPAADVFAFCTTIRDVCGDREDSSWTPVVERGLATDPHARPSMLEVALVLEGRAPRRRRVTYVAALLGAAAVATGLAVSEDAPTCDVDPTAARWDHARRAAFRASFQGAPAADVERVVSIYDARASEISKLSHAVCRASGEALAKAQAARQMGCLERRALELEVVVSRQVAVETDLVHAELRLNRTPLPASCAELTVAEVRDDKALGPLYARYHGPTEQGDKEILRLVAIERDARSVGDIELAARTAVLLGTQQRVMDESTKSDTTLQRAYTESLAIGSFDSATNAAAERLLTLGNTQDVAQTKMLGALANDNAYRSTTTLRARLRLLRAVGISMQARGEQREAMEVNRRAFDEATRSMQRNPDLEMLLRLDLAESLLLLDEHVPDAVNLAREATEIARRFGESTTNYGVALSMLSKASMQNGDIEAALVWGRQALEVWKRIFPPTSSAVIEGRAELGALLVRASRFEEARRELSEVVALAGKSEAMKRVYPWMLSQLAMATAEAGEPEAGLRLLDQAIQSLASTVGFDHPQTISQRISYGAIALELGQLDEVERLVRVLEQSFARTADRHDKRPGLLKGWLASELALRRGRPREAESLARRAITDLTELGAYEELATVQRHLAEALVAQERFADAKPFAEAALTTARTSTLRADELATYELTLAYVENGLGEREEARTRADRLRQIFVAYPLQRSSRAKVRKLLGPAPP